jgi:hypothetical protein
VEKIWGGFLSPKFLLEKSFPMALRQSQKDPSAFYFSLANQGYPAAARGREERDGKVLTNPP